MFMKLSLSMAMIVLCLSARAEESAEAGKARIDLQFKEGGGEGAPKDSGAVYAGEGRKHNLKLAQAEAKRPQAREVPAPGVSSGRSSTASDKAEECAKSNVPKLAVFAVPVGTAAGTLIGFAVGLAIGGIGAVPGASVGTAAGAAAGAAVGAVVAGVTTVMICREANGIPAFRSSGS